MSKVPLSLTDKHKVYLGLLKELDRFCTQNSLRYYLGCGTLIGAVRHKGFIPWDDDLDVFIPESDFRKISETYSSDKYELVTCFNSKAHPFPFARLIDKRTYSMVGRFKSFGLGIDVYIIYGAPSSREEQVEHMNKVFKYIKAKNFWFGVRRTLVRMNLWPFKNLDFSLPNYYVRRAVRELSKYHFDDCEYIWPYGGGRLNLRKDLYGTPQRIPFEDGSYCAPEHYHEVLTAGYGDYMQLPPEEKRVPYHGGVYYWKEQ